ncbi:hypothetical protein BI347_01255 [Chromobacterium sphagni]|uniref:Right handed beta helix domain-containing protein n=1 Tax=Chromobacterium sphagni TaxID=1903179 RepID=A0A1S1WYE2_9NEIS|nr:hypothetical protein [Chromobacterium sphagni]OHX12282.1 hypothetical protein BI347_01255 [Chromobacterium sphagni]
MQDTLKPVLTDDSLFHDGNPASGTPGTVVSADWLNNAQAAIQSTQQEVLTVIKNNGQNADPTRKDQLLQAVQNIAWGSAQRPSTLAGYGIADGASKTDLKTAIDGVVAGAPGALNTLQELAAALGNDSNYAASVTKLLSGKADKASTLAGYGIVDAMKASDWGVQGYTTLQVGPGKAFASIQDAWNSLIGKVLQADVLIQVADGQYATSGIWLNNQPFASRIRIQGNTANPSACKIVLTPDANKLSNGVVFSRVSGVNFSGFHIVGEASANHWSYRCLRVEEAAVVYSDPGTIVLEGAAAGLEVDQNASGNFVKIRISGIKGWAASIIGGAHAILHNCAITGLGINVSTTTPAFVNPDMPSLMSSGLQCVEGSKAWLSVSSISNVFQGCVSASNSYLWADGTAVDQATNAFQAEWGGLIWNSGANPSPAVPNGRRGKASNADIGYLAGRGGTIYAYMATADNCNCGFYAVYSGAIYAANGWSRNSKKVGYCADGLAWLDASGTQAGSYGCTQLYDPAPNTPGNSGAYVYQKITP